MKIIKGWKMLSHDCGYLNDISGQTVVVSKKISATITMFDSLSLEKAVKKMAKQSRLNTPLNLKLMRLLRVGC